MNKPKCDLELYVNFLIASQKQYSCLELEKVSPIESMAHDSPNRLLNRLLLEPQQLWLVVQDHINPRNGLQNAKKLLALRDVYFNNGWNMLSSIC